MDEINLELLETELIDRIRLSMQNLDRAIKLANVLYGEEGEIRQDAMQASLQVCLLLDKTQNTASTRRLNEAALKAQGLRIVK